MKTKILLKSFLALTLIVTFGTYAHASEVTGTLSSSSSNANTTGSEVGGTPGSGTLSGNVVGSNSGGSSSGGSRSNPGIVLGEATVSTNESSLPSNVSADGTYLVASNNFPRSTDQTGVEVTPDGEVLGTEIAQLTPSVQNNMQLSDSNTMSMGTWFWIIFLALIVILTTVYFLYSRKDDKNKVHRA